MASLAFDIWAEDRRQRLEEIARAHRAVGGSKRGRRFATNQINQAYAMLLSAEFQGFCRDLHSECVDFLANSVQSAVVSSILRESLSENRKLDVQNPTPGNLGGDFKRFGIRFWDQVRAYDTRNVHRQQELERLNLWGNAIAHQDFTKVGGSMSLQLATVQKWHRTCSGLAVSFDEVLRIHFQRIMGASPWT